MIEAKLHFSVWGRCGVRKREILVLMKGEKYMAQFDKSVAERLEFLQIDGGVRAALPKIFGMIKPNLLELL